VKDSKHKSLFLVQKYARIFVLGNYRNMYLYPEAHSFPQVTLLENYSLTNICAYFHQQPVIKHASAHGGGGGDLYIKRAGVLVIRFRG